MKTGEAHLSERGSNHQKESIREAERPADSPVVYIHLSCPKQHQPLPPCFRGHPSPHSPVPALLFFLLPQNIRKYFPLLLILPSPHHSPDEQNVTSGLHPSWVQSQPLPLIYSPPINPNRIPEVLASLPQPCFVPTLPSRPWGFSAAPAEGLASIFILLSSASPRPRTHSPELSPQAPPHFKSRKRSGISFLCIFLFFFFLIDGKS